MSKQVLIWARGNWRQSPFKIDSGSVAIFMFKMLDEEINLAAGVLMEFFTNDALRKAVERMVDEFI